MNEPQFVKIFLFPTAQDSLYLPPPTLDPDPVAALPASLDTPFKTPSLKG